MKTTKICAGGVGGAGGAGGVGVGVGVGVGFVGRAIFFLIQFLYLIFLLTSAGYFTSCGWYCCVVVVVVVVVVASASASASASACDSLKGVLSLLILKIRQFRSLKSLSCC